MFGDWVWSPTCRKFALLSPVCFATDPNPDLVIWHHAKTNGAAVVPGLRLHDQPFIHIIFQICKKVQSWFYQYQFVLYVGGGGLIMNFFKNGEHFGGKRGEFHANFRFDLRDKR